ncbi:MAG: flagellar M-ring protein FliF [Rubrivivax sp.]|jgi:flagellar M-ring protein FliF|nr:flagellar M-ring protein FliF [Rubrivivax sp.]
MANELTTAANTASAVPASATLGAKLAALPLRPLIMLALGTAALAALAIALLFSGNKSDYKVLFAGVSDKDGGAIIAQLNQMNVPYRHSDGGSAILVPASQVHDVRMRLGTLGLPKANTGGYELLDTPKFGQTQAGENVAIKRALEGELTRTIASLNAVQNARVMLAIPATSGFFREQQKPSASVVVNLHPGRTLDASQLAGIVHLVSASVPELSPKAVSVVDGNGALLTQQDGQNALGLDAQQLKYVSQIEGTLQRRVMELLEPVVGRENLRASVTAEVDFSESMQVSEQYRPNQGSEPAAVRTQQTSESTGNQPTPPTGVPGAQTNQPPVPASAPVNGQGQRLQPTQPGGAGQTRRDATTQFEVDKTHRTTRTATGTVKRLSAAVVVNHRSVSDGKGKPSSAPLTEPEIQKLTALVEQGIGFSKERGDTVKVINTPFKADEAPKASETPLWQQPWLVDILRAAAIPAGLGFIALLIVMTMVRPALKALNAPSPKPEKPEPGTQLSTMVDDVTPLPDAELKMPAALEGPQMLGGDSLERARNMAKQNPAAVANIVRGLMSGAEEKAT